MAKNLKGFLNDQVIDKKLQDTLLVSDSKLASAISKKMGLNVISDQAVNEVFRGIRSQLSSLITGLAESDMNAMVRSWSLILTFIYRSWVFLIPFQDTS